MLIITHVVCHQSEIADLIIFLFQTFDYQNEADHFAYNYRLQTLESTNSFIILNNQNLSHS